MSRVLGPSELPLPDAGAEQGARGKVAGRVVLAAGGRLVLADAFSAVEFATADLSDVSPGNHLVGTYRVEGGAFVLEEVLELSPAPEPAAGGEFLRLHGDRARALRARDRAKKVVRAYFESEEFLEVETPTFVPSPGLDPHVHSLASVRRGGRTDHLITSPEFHMKRLLVAGLPRIYQLARCFRAEEKGAWHEPEFTLLEWYRAFSGYESMLADTEAIVHSVHAALAPDEPRLPRPFRRMTVRQAFARLAPEHDPIQLAAESPADFFALLVDVIEPAIVALPGPTFLTHYPLPLAGLARICPDDPEVAERFELYFKGKELCNGYGELTDAHLQRARFEEELERRKECGEPLYPIDEKFLAALTEGMPPSAGNALGLDRLVALVLDLPGIAPAFTFTDDER